MVGKAVDKSTCLAEGSESELDEVVCSVLLTPRRLHVD